MGLFKYHIRNKSTGDERLITASSRNSAWGKFVAMYFGALKPARKHYSIDRGDGVSLSPYSSLVLEIGARADGE